jgi:hypothetical protein
MSTAAYFLAAMTAISWIGYLVSAAPRLCRATRDCSPGPRPWCSRWCCSASSPDRCPARGEHGVERVEALYLNQIAHAEQARVWQLELLGAPR